jgi:NADPH:quinone reductase-like Zn-dependent oxidoreductase
VRDRIYALCLVGGYTRLFAEPQDQVMPVPERLSRYEFVPLLGAIFTAWHKVFLPGHFVRSESLLVRAGVSNRCLSAAQIALVLSDTRLFCTASATQKQRVSQTLNARHAVNDHDPAGDRPLHELPQPAGINVNPNSQAAKYVGREAETLPAGGPGWHSSRISAVSTHPCSRSLPRSEEPPSQELRSAPDTRFSRKGFAAT